MDEQDQCDGDEPGAVDTLDHAAVVVCSFVSQGRIGPTRVDDFEAEMLLAWLSILVRQSEPRG